MIEKEFKKAYQELRNKHIEEDEDCVETTTIEWMHEYYVFKNGNYVLTAE